MSVSALMASAFVALSPKEVLESLLGRTLDGRPSEQRTQHTSDPLPHRLHAFASLVEELLEALLGAYRGPGQHAGHAGEPAFDRRALGAYLEFDQCLDVIGLAHLNNGQCAPNVR